MVDKPVIAEGGILLYFIFRQISILNIDFVFLLYPNFSKTLHLNPSIFPFYHNQILLLIFSSMQYWQIA